MSHSNTPVMMKYEIVDKLLGIGKVRPYFCQKTTQSKEKLELMLHLHAGK